MPALKIKSSGAISPRIQAIERNGFIRTMKGKGFRLYVLPLPKMDSAFTTANARIHEGEGQRSPEDSMILIMILLLNQYLRLTPRA